MARGSGIPYFYAHLRRLLGREPTQTEIAGAIAVTEANPRLTGPQDANNILAAIFNRAQAEGRIDTRAYDGVSFRRNPAGGPGLYNKITAKNLAPYASVYKAYQSGARSLPHQQTHYWHPSAMNAIYRKNPRMVRSSPRGNLAGFGRTSIPRWHNPKSAYYAGGRHEGVFTTPRHMVGRVPQRQPSSDMGTDVMIAALKQHNQNNPPPPGRMGLHGPAGAPMPPAPTRRPVPPAVNTGSYEDQALWSRAQTEVEPAGSDSSISAGRTQYVEGAPPAVRGVAPVFSDDTPRGSDLQEQLPWANKPVGGDWRRGTVTRDAQGNTAWELAMHKKMNNEVLTPEEEKLLEWGGTGDVSSVMGDALGGFKAPKWTADTAKGFSTALGGLAKLFG